MQQTEINTRLIQVAAGKRKHANYKRTVEIAERYRALSTRIGINKYMKMYSRRESEQLFAVRCEITEQITSTIIDRLSSIQEKGYRSFYRRELTYGEGETQEKQTMEFEEMLSTYAGGMGVDGYLQARLLELQKTDPNTWIIQDWKDFDNVVEYAAPYPFEATSEMTLDFDYERGELQYLTIQTFFDNPKDKDKPLRKITCWQKRIASVLVETPDTSGGKPSETLEVGVDPIIDGKRWVYQEYTHGLTDIKARRAGYRRDLATNGATFVWPYEPAEPYLMQTLKVVSELQLTAANVAMPQTIRFGDECKAKDCDGGETPTGTCGVCGGTGKKKSSTSVLEEIVIAPMPESPEHMLDLSKMIHYVSPEVSILEWQEKYSDKLEEKCISACIHSDIFSRKEIADTATGKNIDQENANDFVYKYFVFYAGFWQHVVLAYAEIVGKSEGLSAEIVVNKDLKLKTLNQLLADLKQANDSGASPAARQAIEWDIMRIITLDTPHEFEEYKVRERFNPFSGFSDDQKAIMMQSPLVPISQRTLYANLGYIFDQLEYENVGFYKLPFATQKALVDEKVAALVADTAVPTPELTI